MPRHDESTRVSDYTETINNAAGLHREEAYAATPPKRLRVIAYYLPQFHPIPENDQWWGKGFTDWKNVVKAGPLFRGHYQPHLPADLGFYDLRLPEVREAQANLARENGIDGFCYWHYWFMGKRLLGRPLDDVLASGRPDFPFCLGWANESWTRRWTGEEVDILLKQDYSDADDLSHASWLAEVFDDPRYIRIQGRPLLVVHRPQALPNPQRTLDLFRAKCVRLGSGEPFIVGRDTHSPGADLRDLGCDTTEASYPHLPALLGAFEPGGRWNDWQRNMRLGAFTGALKVFDYEEACAVMERTRPSHPHVRSFFVGWDNTPRRGRDAIILTRSTPEAFARRLRVVLSGMENGTTGEQLVFLNAWNEWAEGMHLEPDQRFGTGFLQAVKSEVERHSRLNLESAETNATSV